MKQVSISINIYLNSTCVDENMKLHKYSESTNNQSNAATHPKVRSIFSIGILSSWSENS